MQCYCMECHCIECCKNIFIGFSLNLISEVFPFEFPFERQKTYHVLSPRSGIVRHECVPVTLQIQGLAL